MRIYGSKDGLLNDRINSHFLPFTRLLILGAAVPGPGPCSATFMPSPAPRAISTTADINRRARRLTSERPSRRRNRRRMYRGLLGNERYRETFLTARLIKHARLTKRGSSSFLEIFETQRTNRRWNFTGKLSSMDVIYRERRVNSSVEISPRGMRFPRSFRAKLTELMDVSLVLGYNRTCSGILSQSGCFDGKNRILVARLKQASRWKSNLLDY